MGMENYLRSGNLTHRNDKTSKSGDFDNRSRYTKLKKNKKGTRRSLNI